MEGAEEEVAAAACDKILDSHFVKLARSVSISRNNGLDVVELELVKTGVPSVVLNRLQIQNQEDFSLSKMISFVFCSHPFS